MEVIVRIVQIEGEISIITETKTEGHVKTVGTEEVTRRRTIETMSEETTGITEITTGIGMVEITRTVETTTIIEIITKINTETMTEITKEDIETKGVI